MVRRKRLTITLRRDLLKQIDHMINENDARNRSHAIERVLSDRFGGSVVRKAISIEVQEKIIERDIS